MEEVELLENRDLRESLMEHCEVLEKVKQLLLLPGTEYATMKQVAEFYGVEQKVIERTCERHIDELRLDGVCNKKYTDLSIQHYVGLKTRKGKVTFSFENGDTLDYPTRGAKIFPRRAILRVGMLLRDSEVAKEVRTQLLNIEEKVPDPVKVADITEEQMLYLDIGRAYSTGDPDQIMLATGKLTAYKNRHIQQLETDNKALTGSILEWGDRKKIGAAICKLASVAGLPYGTVWNQLYTNLQYKYSIDLRKRGTRKPPFIQYVREDEWDKVLQSFSAICEVNHLSPTDMFQNIRMEAATT